MNGFGVEYGSEKNTFDLNLQSAKPALTSRNIRLFTAWKSSP